MQFEDGVDDVVFFVDEVIVGIDVDIFDVDEFWVEVGLLCVVFYVLNSGVVFCVVFQCGEVYEVVGVEECGILFNQFFVKVVELICCIRQFVYGDKVFQLFLLELGCFVDVGWCVCIVFYEFGGCLFVIDEIKVAVEIDFICSL